MPKVEGTQECGTQQFELLEQETIGRIFSGFALEAQKQMSTDIEQPKQKILVISGPTCSGKTDLSLMLAEAMNGEIVSADSMQVYRHMDIGTAKALPQQRERVPHHLIDIRNISEPFNVVDFYYEARHACREILIKGKVPIVVGGSGFYLHSFLYGPPSGPPSVPELRKSLEEEADYLGLEALFERLKKLDPQYAASITKHDRQKIIRGLEIITLSGKQVSKLSWTARRKPLNYDFHCWFLYRPREVLYHRIEKRCEKMVELGFFEEVEKLVELGLRTNSSACQAIGYRQALEYLDSHRHKDDLKRFEADFKQASRNYAKRQFTWFRKELLFKWLDLDMHDPETAVDIIRQEYELTI